MNGTAAAQESISLSSILNVHSQPPPLQLHVDFFFALALAPLPFDCVYFVPILFTQPHSCARCACVRLSDW